MGSLETDGEVFWGDNVIIEITAQQETAAGLEIPQQG